MLSPEATKELKLIVDSIGNLARAAGAALRTSVTSGASPTVVREVMHGLYYAQKQLQDYRAAEMAKP
jgi:hypothetical protein